MAHRFTVTACSCHDNSSPEKLKKPARFVRIMETATASNADSDPQQHAVPPPASADAVAEESRSTPECELYDETPPDSAQVTETVTSATALLTLDKRHGDKIGQPHGQSPKTPVFNVDFSLLPIGGENRNGATREGTPLSMTTLTTSDLRFKKWQKRGDEAFVTVISALYAKILVIMGLAFPMSEVISTHVTSSSYLGFYIFLYVGSIFYLLYVFFSLVKEKVSVSCSNRKKRKGSDDGLIESGFDADHKLRPRTFSNDFGAPHQGSFYLRIGAVAFGVGSMIYSCLEFGQYFEVDTNSHCHDILIAITPAARMLFTFIQMYFIFLNAKMTIRHNKAIAHFGLMHMIATNLCVWLNVIIEETKHEILFDHHEDQSHSNKNDVEHIYSTSTARTPTVATAPLDEVSFNSSEEIFQPIADALVSALDSLAPLGVVEDDEISLVDECRRSEVLGNLVQEASPLLFPCAIEYSLICAAILYVMWKNISSPDSGRRPSSSSTAGRRSRHHYSVDCARANKGLFSGIFVLVLTIISLILFFALINKQDYKAVAIMEVNMSRLVLYTMAFIAVLIGLYQVRELRFDACKAMDLDDVLLIFGQIGVISYNTFTIIAAHFKMETQDTALVLSTAVACLLQALSQTLFILDASRRNTYTADQQRRKPGREVVTFLLVANFAMWTVNTLEKSRADVNPVQLQFYGKWSWIIITNVSMPLAIFYRFHSTVALCEIWKRCYKARHEIP